MKVGICGYGWVGKAMHKLFPDAVIYDPYVPISGEAFYNNKEEVNECDVVFICVPTPVIGEGKLDTSIVEEIIKWCKCRLLVIRSTVNPGDCNRWSNDILTLSSTEQRIAFQPEYLGETPNHPLLDPKSRPFLIIGGSNLARRELIDLYATVYNANVTIRQVTNYEAEVIKLSENRAIAFKVAECQELFDICEKAGVDYYTIREAVYSDDPRFNLWWTFIYPEKRGFNSKCIPKDVYAWASWAESLGYDPKITRAILEKNKEWIK
jgi:UDPglucose 6-dehydrogenase